jgi:hypothetical protein
MAVTLCTAQVTVTNQGFATTPGYAVPATPVSPPIMYAPIIRLDQGPTQPVEAVAVAPNETTAASNGAAPQEALPFNFGMAQYEVASSAGGVGQDINGQSLADFARKQRKGKAPVNAKVYTNSDIQALPQPVGTVGANAPVGSWSPNNGVINPEGQANASRMPSQTNQNRPPFPPKSNLDTPVEPENAQEAAGVRPVNPAGTEIAQNNQPAPFSQPSSNSASSQNEELPQTASRLPLIGVLGLFTVCAGMFVRYQRARSR